MSNCSCGCGEHCRCDAWCPCGCGYSSDDIFAFLDVRDGRACGCNEDLSESQNRSLDDDQLARVAGHVTSCPACQSRLAREEAVRRATTSLGTEQAPARLYASVRARLSVTTLTRHHR